MKYKNVAPKLWPNDMMIVPGKLPIVGYGGNNVCSTCHVHACVGLNTHMVPSSAAQTWYEGEKSDGHTMLQFCLKSEISLEHRRLSRSPVSCARNAADDEGLQQASEVVSASAWIICVLTKNNYVSGDKKPRNSCYSAILKRLIW